MQAADALDQELSAGVHRVEGQQPVVNDLSGMVKKKKKVAAAAASGSSATGEANGSAVNGGAASVSNAVAASVSNRAAASTGKANGGGTKRKAEEDAEGSGSEKKTKLD